MKRGFTLVEIMIVVAIIGLLAAIAIPNFVRARLVAQQNACIYNLKKIEQSVQIWAIHNEQGTGDTPTTADIVPNYLKSWPTCRGMAYVAPSVGADPVCPNNIANHTI